MLEIGKASLALSILQSSLWLRLLFQPLRYRLVGSYRSYSQPFGILQKIKELLNTSSKDIFDVCMRSEEVFAAVQLWRDGKGVKARALIDTGAVKSIMSGKLAKN